MTQQKNLDEYINIVFNKLKETNQKTNHLPFETLDKQSKKKHGDQIFR